MQREDRLTERLNTLLHVQSVSELPDVTQSNATVMELTNLMTLAKQSGITNVIFDITLMWALITIQILF